MENNFADQLRQAIAESSMSRYAISRETGIAQSTLSKFVGGERGLSLDSVDRLMTLLELEITPRKRKVK
jgi:transcriptional regulator with XRE-family HTH domain